VCDKLKNFDQLGAYAYFQVRLQRASGEEEEKKKVYNIDTGSRLSVVGLEAGQRFSRNHEWRTLA
jgi:hypothetical protein